MTKSQPQGNVVLADQQAASAVLYSVLAEVTAAAPDTFSAFELPRSARSFRKDYGEVLPRFEALRLASLERVDLARCAVAAFGRQLHWLDAAGGRPLADALTEPVKTPRLKIHEFKGKAGWRPSLVYQGRRWETEGLSELGSTLVDRGVSTPSAGAALGWVGEHLVDDGAIRLSGRKIAVIGAGAEMAPTRFWLEAGADVLWLDVLPPPESWLDESKLSGRLFWPVHDVDLLSRPQEVLSTLRAFADGAPVDLGLYAYAPGKARELLLTGVMNALVDALPEELLASVTLLVSPTTAAALSAGDLALARARLEARPTWEAMLAGLGLLGRGGGSVRAGESAASRSIVAIQGASYQAAQYLGKVLVAESWAEHGPAAAAVPTPLRVSANTAAITRTRSLNHPVFSAAFGGAAAFGVETMSPRFSRRLNGLLALRDWLHPELPEPGAIRVHGGIHTLPYPLDPPLRVAAAIGFVRSPRLLAGLIGK